MLAIVLIFFITRSCHDTLPLLLRKLGDLSLWASMFVYSSGIARVLLSGRYSTYQFKSLDMSGVKDDDCTAEAEKGTATKLTFGPDYM